VPDGPAKGQISKLDEMLEKYYNLRGWNGEGKALPETLKALELDG